MHTASEALGGVLCGVLLMWSMDAAVYVQVVVGWIPLLIALSLVEPPGERMDANNHLANMREIFEHLLKSGAVLRLTFIALSIWSLTTFYAVWLLQKLWQEQGVELSQFGYLWAIYMLVSAGAGRLALKAEDRFGATTLLAFVGVLPAVGYAGLALFGTVGGFVAALTFFVARGLGLVVLRDAFNKRLPGRFRATANSLASFGFRAAFAVTGPFVGWTLDLWGMDVTLGAAGGRVAGDLRDVAVAVDAGGAYCGGDGSGTRGRRRVRQKEAGPVGGRPSCLAARRASADFDDRNRFVADQVRSALPFAQRRIDDLGEVAGTETRGDPFRRRVVVHRGPLTRLPVRPRGSSRASLPATSPGRVRRRRRA